MNSQGSYLTWYTEGMIQSLLDSEILYLSEHRSRRLTLPNGQSETVAMAELYWRWFDRIQKFEAALLSESDTSFLELAATEAKAYAKTLDEHLPELIAYEVEDFEKRGIDLCEPDWVPELNAAKRATARFYKRNPKRIQE